MSFDQVPLQIIPRRAYSARNFAMHSGVAEPFAQLTNFLGKQHFRIAVLSAPPRSGLTHCIISLAQSVSEAGMFPRIVEGSDFFDWANERLAQEHHDSGEVIFVDDADQYLANLAAHDSGHFVNVVEYLRRNNGAIVFAMHKSYAECGCDAHVLSRLNAAQQLELAQPADADIESLLSQMAIQRGISLTKRNAEYLAKRLPRSIDQIDQYLERAQQIAQVSGKGFKLPVLSDALFS